MNRKIRFISFYLPQFHPIAENDEWWGKGFTEWTNTAKAKPLFRGHYQPHVPADLGFYDLRVPETRAAQAEMAREYGIEAFCYYHYWFAGKRLLARPFSEVLQSGEPDFPFCLCWANQTWTGIWHGSPDRTLIEQTYPGKEDDCAHFRVLLQAFTDPRYVTVDGKPLFCVFRPMELPNALKVTDLWREMAVKAGLKGLYLVGVHEPEWRPASDGFDASVCPRLWQLLQWIRFRKSPVKNLFQRYAAWRGLPAVYSYEDVLSDIGYIHEARFPNYPCVIPNWDNTPRSAANGLVLHNSTPQLFEKHLSHAVEVVERKLPEHRIIFVKAWNEWAEGNHLEPDLRFGKAYLEVVQRAAAVTRGQTNTLARIDSQSASSENSIFLKRI